MANSVTTTPQFDRDVKKLSKKYHSLKKSLLELEKDLIENPRLGVSYGKNIYKIRLEGEGKGKSGGYRVLTYVVDESQEDTVVFLVTIFSKTEESTIKKADAENLIDDLGL
jgi:mRNA-degrading endonuclease RelE of RelBE toxin-antitoxin system